MLATVEYINTFYKPVMSNHTNSAATGHNSLFKGLAQRDSVTPEKEMKKKITWNEYFRT